MDEGNPLSWCFGATQAPQYMRPFHPELVAVTLEYAMKMAITARNLLIREAEQDAGQARHLQETLIRMYKQDNDPNIDLAVGRATGIAEHYTRKEELLNIRLPEEDQPNIPTEVNEWADILCRRKVSKPSTRSRSRSKSRDKKKDTKKANAKNAPKNQKASTSTQGQPQKRKNTQQQGLTFQQWKQSKVGPTQQNPRPSSSSTSIQAKPSLNSLAKQSVHQAQMIPNNTPYSAATNNQRPTNLNEEELRLITLLRASKN